MYILAFISIFFTQKKENWIINAVSLNWRKKNDCFIFLNYFHSFIWITWITRNFIEIKKKWRQQQLQKPKQLKFGFYNFKFSKDKIDLIETICADCPLEAKKPVSSFVLFIHLYNHLYNCCYCIHKTSLPFKTRNEKSKTTLKSILNLTDIFESLFWLIYIYKN